jgi:hypothetical protein
MNEPVVLKEPEAPPDPEASSPTPPPATEPFFGTLRRVWARLNELGLKLNPAFNGRDRHAHRESEWRLGYLKQGKSHE